MCLEKFLWWMSLCVHELLSIFVMFMLILIACFVWCDVYCCTFSPFIVCHIMCITVYHITLFSTPRMQWYRGSFMFSLNMWLWHLRPKLDFHSYAHIYGELYVYPCIQNQIYISYCEALIGLSSITKKGEIESASRPLVGFGVWMTTRLKS